jgi:osmotically inducible lipoprotein OsmB
MIRTLIALAIACTTLAGCGETVGDRTLSGAGIGAAGGALIGAAVGAPLAGAAIGAAAGGVTGAVTTPSQVDLGRPVWENR